MQRLHIFRAGSHAPMQGGVLSFAAKDLAATAAAYDPARFEAPLVIGHPDVQAPAYGWVRSLAAEGSDLLAEPHQVDASFAAMVKAGRFKKISASFFSPTHRDNPAPGVWSLHHVGFLGAARPAVQGLREVAFAAGDADLVTVEFAAPSASMLGWLLGDVASLFRGIRDQFVADKGAAEADRLIPGSTVQRIAEEAARLQVMPDAPADPAPSFAAPPPTTSQESPVPDTDTAAREAALNAREAEIAARETRVAEQQREARQAEAASFAARLVREARLPQGLAPRAAALLATMPEEGVVSFAAGGETTREAPAAALRALLEGLPQAVPFGGITAPPGPGDEAPAHASFSGMRVEPERGEIHAKALAYQRAHPGTDYVTAALAVEQAG